MRVETPKREDLDALLPPGAVHQGVVLETAPLSSPSLETFPPASDGRQVILALDEVTDPHNVGAIIRSAAAFGAAGVLLCERHAPPETGTLVKSASGAFEKIPLVRVPNLGRALKSFQQKNFWCAGLTEEAEAPLAEAALPEKIILVLGAEGKGLRRLTRETCDFLFRLPLTGAVESLNVSNAAAVALYELLGR